MDCGAKFPAHHQMNLSCWPAGWMAHQAAGAAQCLGASWWAALARENAAGNPLHGSPAHGQQTALSASTANARVCELLVATSSCHGQGCQAQQARLVSAAQWGGLRTFPYAPAAAHTCASHGLTFACPLTRLLFLAWWLRCRCETLSMPSSCPSAAGLPRLGPGPSEQSWPEHTTLCLHHLSNSLMPELTIQAHVVRSFQRQRCTGSGACGTDQTTKPTGALPWCHASTITAYTYQPSPRECALSVRVCASALHAYDDLQIPQCASFLSLGS